MKLNAPESLGVVLVLVYKRAALPTIGVRSKEHWVTFNSL